MEQWERGFFEGKNKPYPSRSLELKIDNAKPETCAEDPAGGNATTTSTPASTTAPSGGDSSARTSMGLMVAAVTLMALSYKY